MRVTQVAERALYRGVHRFVTLDIHVMSDVTKLYFDMELVRA
jgi:hypothetical protein